MKVQQNNDGRLFIYCSINEYHPMRYKLRTAKVKFRSRGEFVLEVIEFPSNELRRQFMEACGDIPTTKHFRGVVGASQRIGRTNVN